MCVYLLYTTGHQIWNSGFDKKETLYRFTAKGIKSSLLLSMDCTNTSGTEANPKVFEYVTCKSRRENLSPQHEFKNYLYCTRSHNNSLHFSVFLQSIFKDVDNKNGIVQMENFFPHRKKTRFLVSGLFTTSFITWIENQNYEDAGSRFLRNVGHIYGTSRRRFPDDTILRTRPNMNPKSYTACFIVVTIIRGIQHRRLSQCLKI